LAYCVGVGATTLRSQSGAAPVIPDGTRKEIVPPTRRGQLRSARLQHPVRRGSFQGSRARRREMGGQPVDPVTLEQVGPYQVRRFVDAGSFAWVFEVVDPKFAGRRLALEDSK
jgi:hypothetical protein